MPDRSERQNLLIIAAAPAEGRAVCAAFDRPPPDRDWAMVELGRNAWLTQSGVGKVNAALCTARMVDPTRFHRVISLGVCGALPAPGAGVSVQVGEVIIADRSVYADEGIATDGPSAGETGFTDMSAAGFPPGGWPRPAFAGNAIETDAALRQEIAQRLDAQNLRPVIGTIATVSTCSGTDALARAIALRTGAVAEAMEGAAIGHALARMFEPAPAFAEVRIVSNTTGDRSRQVWALKGALARLTAVAGALANQ